MRIGIFSDMINKELTFLVPRAVAAAGVIYLITLPLYGFCVDVPLGIVLGTIVMLVNFILIGYSAERAVERPISSAKRYMMLFYGIRMAICAALFILAAKSKYINLPSAVIPLFFPKIIYTLDAAVKKRKEGKD